MGIMVDRSNRVHFSNIPLAAIEADGAEAMQGEFAKYGPIERYVLFTDASGHFTGSGMCTYRNAVDAEQAIEALNKSEHHGQMIEVSIAKEHGVIDLTGQDRKRRGFDSDGKWTHDLCSAQDRERGRGRGRGRRGFRSNFDDGGHWRGRGRGRNAQPNSAELDARLEDYQRQARDQDNQE